MLRVRVVPLSTPLISRRCPRCDQPRPFASSERFRVNASGGRLDVWLIYRCTTCDFTWNREVLARVPVGAIAPERLRAFHDNDRNTAWACAFASAGEAPWRVEVSGDGGDELHIELPFPCVVRLERVLVAALGLSRAEIARRFGADRALRRPARDGQVVRALPAGPSSRPATMA